MCFGKKDHYDPSATAAKPAAFPPQQPTYASASVPSGKTAVPAPAPGYQPLQQQQQQQLISELGGDEIAPPPGPPPSQRPPVDDYTAPPPGPPPSHQRPASDDYTAPPPGPPPSSSKQHDWETAVPDTSLLPPPPDLFSGWDRSPASNATAEEAEAGEAWCAENPLSAPLRELAREPQLVAQIAAHNVRLVAPPGYRGELRWAGSGNGSSSSSNGAAWTVKSERGARDACVIGYPPLYCVSRHSPLLAPPLSKGGNGSAGNSTTIYYEVRVLPSGSRDEVSLALGYAALPYPPFRLPGWHRGSLAVHGDDGHRYVNDRWGGHSFTALFRRGDTYGIGMTFTATGFTPSPPSYSSSSSSGRDDKAGLKGAEIRVEVFFTRNGAEAGRWDLHEETDAQQDLPVTGLEGYHDLACAVGTFDAVAFEVVFDPARWKYRGVTGLAS